MRGRSARLSVLAVLCCTLLTMLKDFQKKLKSLVYKAWMHTIFTTNVFIKIAEFQLIACSGCNIFSRLYCSPVLMISNYARGVGK